MGKKNVSPDQFKLFMSATEWKDHVQDSVDLPEPDSFHSQHKDAANIQQGRMNRMWDRKLEESKLPETEYDHGSGLHDSISEKGFQVRPIVNKFSYYEDRPVVYVNKDGTKMQGEGHHRIAAAADIEQKTGKVFDIPTNYEKNW